MWWRVAVNRLACLFPLAEWEVRMFPFPGLPGNIKGHRVSVVKNYSVRGETIAIGRVEVEMMHNADSARKNI